MLPDLSNLLTYKHHKVIQSFVRNYLVDEIKAHELFDDMLRYLWISKKHAFALQQEPENKAIQFSFVMHEEMRNIDNMWHNFILYTQDYTEFCLQNFGEYLHHMPDVAEKIQQTDDEFACDLEKYLSYVYDNLGAETVKRWFSPHI